MQGYDKKTHKRCIKCREWKPRTGEDRAFGLHGTSADGLQSICTQCKTKMSTESREKNVVMRVRHHMSTRCLTQLGDLAPKNFTANMEEYLGYSIKQLVKYLSADLRSRPSEGPERKLRDALQEGYHIDHIRPLSSFKVRVVRDGVEGVDWEAFRECWAIENLTAIPASVNLAKGAKLDWEHSHSPPTSTRTRTSEGQGGPSATTRVTSSRSGAREAQHKQLVEDILNVPLPGQR